MNNNRINTSENNQAESEYFGIMPIPETVTATMAYVPFQTDTTEYLPETAFVNGTLFTDLNKPFFGGKCK